MNEVECKICGKKYSIRSLGNHVKRTHNIMPEQYYTDHIQERHTCLECGKLTVFRGIKKGYQRFCSLKCSTNNSDIKNKVVNTLMKRYNVTNAMYNDCFKTKCINSLNKTLETKKDEIIERRKRSKEEKYGNENYNNREKASDTSLERYGETNYNNREKFNNTCMNKFGVMYPTQSSEVIKTRKRNNISKYGVDETSKLNSVRKKISIKSSERFKDPIYKKIWHNKLIVARKELGTLISEKSKLTNRANRGVDYPTQSSDVKEKSRNSYLITFRKKIAKHLEQLNISLVDGDSAITFTRDLVTLRCNTCGRKFKNRWYNINLGYGKCPKCNPANKPSKPHMEIATFIESLGFSVLINDREIIRPLEVDIVVPDKKLCIEINGLYWHSLKDENYHKNKTESCKNMGYRLLQIYQDEWDYKKDIIMSTIKHILGANNSNRIMARKCKIQEIDTKLKNEFLNSNHILGADKSNIKLGAYYNSDLVAVMTFSHGNISRGGKPTDKTTYEMSRFCVDREYIVSGIADKILKYFKNNFEWNLIYTYADLRWSTGNLYDKLGFEVSSIVKPSYFYISKNGTKRIHRFLLRKKKNDSKDIPEWLLRSKEGYRKIYDCGKIKYILKNNKNEGGQ